MTKLFSEYILESASRPTDFKTSEDIKKAVDKFDDLSNASKPAMARAILSAAKRLEYTIKKQEILKYATSAKAPETQSKKAVEKPNIPKKVDTSKKIVKKEVKPQDVKVGDETISYGGDIGKVFKAPIPASEWRSVKKFDGSGWMDDEKALSRSIDMKKDYLIVVDEGDNRMVYVYGDNGAWVEKELKTSKNIVTKLSNPKDIKKGDQYSFGEDSGKIIKIVPAKQWKSVKQYDSYAWMTDEKTLEDSGVDFEKDYLVAYTDHYGEDIVSIYGKHAKV